VKNSMKPSRLSLPRSATVSMTTSCAHPAAQRGGVGSGDMEKERTANAQRRLAMWPPLARTSRPQLHLRARAHCGNITETYDTRRIEKTILNCYYRNKNAILSSQVCSFTITRCTTVDFACDVHVVRSSISRLSKCLSVLIRALSRQSADSPARPRIAFAHDDDDDAHNSSRRKSAVLPDHCSILHPQVPSTILAPRRPLCRPNVTTLACPRRTGRRGGYIFSHRHDWMSA